MELISVIVPIYNTEKYLERCVKSIQNQTYSNLEIILVNDGSTDDSLLLCEKFKDDIRVKVISKQNAGQGLARNDGLKVANGMYVTFVDSDDWIGEEHIANLYKAITDQNADVAIGNHVWVSVDGTEYIKMLDLQETIYKGDDLLYKIVLPLIGADASETNDVLINSSVSMNLYKMSVIHKNEIQFISERFAVAEDFFFNLDYLQHASSAVYCNEYGYFYCQNIESTCEKYNPERFTRTLNYYEVLIERIKTYGLIDSVEYRAERSFLMKIRVAIRHIVMSNLSKKEKIVQIKTILNSKTVFDVLCKYPINTYDFSIKLLMKMMKTKKVYGVYCLMYLRERGRSNVILRKVMRFCGLNR